MASYIITAEDVKGPFTKIIPRDLVAQAALPTLGYRSVLEKLGERFHSAPALLQRMNHASRFAAGDVTRIFLGRGAPRLAGEAGRAPSCSGDA